MKEAEAANITAIANGSTLTPSCSETAIAIGNISTAAALLVITSVNTAVSTYTIASATQGVSGPHPNNKPATHCAAPVSVMALPKAKDAAITTSTGKSTLRLARLAVRQPLTIIAPAAIKAASRIDNNPDALNSTITAGAKAVLGLQRISAHQASIAR